MPPNPSPASTRPLNTKAGLVPSIKRTSHACERCQILRVKCSGGERCQKCVQDSADCAYKDRKRERNKQIQATLDEVLGENDLLRQRNQELLAALTKLSSNTRLDPDHVSPVLELIGKQNSNALPASQSSRSAPTNSKKSPGELQSTASSSHVAPSRRTSKDATERLSRSSTLISTAENEHIPQTYSPQADVGGSWVSANSAPYVDITNMPHGVQHVHVGPALRLSTMPTERHIIPKQEPMTPTSATVAGMTPNFNNAPPYSPTHQYSFSGLHNTFPSHNRGLSFAEADSTLCRVYTDYRTAAQQLISSGRSPLSSIIGPDYVCVDLFFRERRPDDAQSVCNWASELAKSFQDFDVFVRMACALLYTYLMRWMLDPTPENYARIPEMIRPTHSQILVPHSPCVDLVALPEMREALLKDYRDWLTPMMSVTLDWPYTMAQAIEMDPYTSNMCLTRAFEQHVTDPTSWVFTTSSILESFPELAGKVRIRTGPPGQ